MSEFVKLTELVLATDGGFVRVLLAGGRIVTTEFMEDRPFVTINPILYEANHANRHQ